MGLWHGMGDPVGAAVDSCNLPLGKQRAGVSLHSLGGRVPRAPDPEAVCLPLESLLGCHDPWAGICGLPTYPGNPGITCGLPVTAGLFCSLLVM